MFTPLVHFLPSASKPSKHPPRIQPRRACDATYPACRKTFPNRVLVRCPKCHQNPPHYQPDGPAFIPEIHIWNDRTDLREIQCPWHGFLEPEVMLWVCAFCDFKNEAFFKKCWNCQAPYGRQCPLIWECAPVEERPEGFTLGYESPVESESEEEPNGEESYKYEEIGDDGEMKDVEMTDMGEVGSGY